MYMRIVPKMVETILPKMLIVLSSVGRCYKENDRSNAQHLSQSCAAPNVLQLSTVPTLRRNWLGRVGSSPDLELNNSKRSAHCETSGQDSALAGCGAPGHSERGLIGHRSTLFLNCPSGQRVGSQFLSLRRLATYKFKDRWIPVRSPLRHKSLI